MNTNETQYTPAVGDPVIVTPKDNDFLHEFGGTLIDIVEIGKMEENNYIVEDMDGDCFQVDYDQLAYNAD